MSIRTTWENHPRTHILITFERPWLWAEFEHSRHEMLQLLSSVNHSVDIIIDVRQAGFPPPNAIKPFRQVAEINHPNGGQVIFVAPRILARFVESIIRLLSATFPESKAIRDFQMVFAPTLEDAYSILDRQTLARRAD